MFNVPHKFPVCRYMLLIKIEQMLRMQKLAHSKPMSRHEFFMMFFFHSEILSWHQNGPHCWWIFMFNFWIEQFIPLPETNSKETPLKIGQTKDAPKGKEAGWPNQPYHFFQVFQPNSLFVSFREAVILPPGMCRQMSNEKRAPGCSGYIGNEILPSYIGVIS